METNYASRNSFEAYTTYLGLKRHFTTPSYDYHKYHGKVKASYDKFKTRRDVFQFHKLSRKRDYQNIILANLLKNQNCWVGDLIEDEGYEVYLEWKKRIDALTYNFTRDLSKLDDPYFTNFNINEGQHPKLLTLYLQKEISLETLAILMHLSQATEYWESRITDKYIAGNAIELAKKYYPFLEIDKKKLVSIVKDKFF